MEIRQQYCPTRKIWKIDAYSVRSQQKPTHLLRSHRLSSRGERFTTLSDDDRLFLNLFSNDRVDRAVQRLGVRAAFCSLKYGERYDVTHPVNLRHLLRDIANGEILSCMMSVLSIGWNLARDCRRPLRSSAQSWRIEKSRFSMSLSDLTCLDTGNIMRTVIKLTRQRQRFNVCNSVTMTLLISAHVHTEAESIRWNWQVDSRICFRDPPSPSECRERAMIWTCNGIDDTSCCAVSSFRRVQSATSGLPYYPVAETLPRRDEIWKIIRTECQSCAFLHPIPKYREICNTWPTWSRDYVWYDEIRILLNLVFFNQSKYFSWSRYMY